MTWICYAAVFIFPIALGFVASAMFLAGIDFERRPLTTQENRPNERPKRGNPHHEKLRPWGN